MLRVAYKLAIGAWAVSSADDPRSEFTSLETNQSLDSPADFCRVLIYAPPAPQPGLLEQAATAAAGALRLGGGEEAETFSIQVRGEKIKHSDEITIELTVGETSDKVMTAEVQTINSSFGQTKITGKTGMQKLADMRLNQVYENQSLSQIINDLASQAEVDTGEIETGSTYSYFVVHESKSLLKHIRELARRDGMEVYFDIDNKLTIRKFTKSSADHTFYYGIDILDLQLFNHQMPSDRIRVYGESPASNQGADTWHWLAKDISPFQSEVGDGKKTLAIRDGALRTKDAADSFATAKFGAIKDQSAWGRLKILGNPKVKLADAIEIKNAPKPELNGLFKVTSVRHVLNKREGYLTFAGFTGQGGAGEAGGLLGALGGQLAGAVGL
jgi:hypothetical protein